MVSFFRIACGIYLFFSTVFKHTVVAGPVTRPSGISCFCISKPLNAHFPAKPWVSGTWWCIMYVLSGADSPVSKNVPPEGFSARKLCLCLLCPCFLLWNSRNLPPGGFCLFPCFFFSAGESTSADSWTEAAANNSEGCAPRKSWKSILLPHSH